jgi:hypothetical protein
LDSWPLSVLFRITLVDDLSLPFRTRQQAHGGKQVWLARSIHPY